MSSLPIAIKTKENLVITVKKGCVTKEDVDVVINSTQDNLQLNAGILSSSILKAAGSAIQDECNQKSPNGIKRGQVVDTCAGNMPAKTIYHGSLSPWLNGNGEADLRAFIRCFLDKANVERKTSMAIPAIYTGVLNSPAEVVAKVMYEEIVNFSRANPRTTLKDVRIMLICEPQLTEFARYFSFAQAKPVWQQTASHPSLPPAPRAGSKQMEWQSNEPSSGSASGSKVESGEVSLKTNGNTFWAADPAERQSDEQSSGSNSTGFTDDSVIVSLEINGLNVRVKTGNISEAQTDIIVNVTTRDLKLNHCEVSNVIRGAAGSTIEYECRANAPSGIQYGEMVKTGGGRLSGTIIYHVALQPASDTAEKDLRTILANIFDNAVVDEHRSVALPSFCMGIKLKYPAKMVAKCMLEEIYEFSAANPNSTLSDVEIVLFRQDHATINAFETYLQSKCKFPVKITTQETQRANLQLNSDGDQLYKMELLSNTSKEYKAVFKRFTDTGGPRNVQKIERVQNPTMHEVYVLQRSQVERAISGKTEYEAEQILFHGTSKDVLNNINTSGFNRSFGGKHAMALGVGTYFAKYASYSCRDIYSPTDKDGYKYVYQCRVLTGEYTAGCSDFKQPPSKPQSNALYDSVVDDVRNPMIFVVSKDAQAYPEYLITFKE